LLAAFIIFVGALILGYVRSPGGARISGFVGVALMLASFMEFYATAAGTRRLRRWLLGQVLIGILLVVVGALSVRTDPTLDQRLDAFAPFVILGVLAASLISLFVRQMRIASIREEVARQQAQQDARYQSRRNAGAHTDR
jgi:uncharacterized small protein (DUF1192 family)